MMFTLQTTRKMGFLALILGVCLFSAQTVFSQAKTWDGGASTNVWSDAANWNGDVAPINTDSVVIAAGQDIVVTAGTALCRKLNIYGDGTSQGKVTVNSGATLNVNSTTNTTTTGVPNAALILFGGMLENNGAMTITGRQAVDALRFDNPTTGTLSSTYKGSGSLNCSTSNSTGGGGSASTGASITFVQTSGTAIFTLSSTGTYGMNTITGAVGSTPFHTKSAILCLRGTAKIDGTGTITTSGGKRTIRIAPSGANEAPNLTIESGITMNMSSTMINGTGGTAASNTGIVVLENSFAGATPVLTNKGMFNFSGDVGNPIAVINGTAATQITSFINEGTININGTFADASTNVTWGGIFMGGANTTVGNSFTNASTGNINFNVTGTSAKPLLYAITTPKNLFTNNGTITIGTGGAPVNAFRLGDSKTTVNNAGTIAVGAGNIIGAIASAVFNNNTNGILNFVLAPAASAIGDNVTFTNAGGSLRGSGTFSNGSTGGNLFTSGTIAPGQSPGQIILNDAALTLNGTYNAEINGKTTAGVDYDQIAATAAAVNVAGLTIAIASSGYTPVTGDIIPLINAASLVGTPTFTLPAGWAGSVSGGQIVITYTTPLAVELTRFKATPLSKINVLTWETASETNNKGFGVERQSGDGTWASLGFVNGTGKASTYTFEDKGLLSISYYRLRQVDFDGKETLSKVVSVRQDSKGHISITPNPTSDKVNISLSQNDGVNQEATLILFDMAGRQVLTQRTTSDNLQLDLSNLAKGVYLLTVQSNHAVYQEKIVRQ